jgi:uncharacterized protein
MLSQLPEQADPRRLCEQGKGYEGRVALRGLARLAPLLTSDEGEAAFTLRFDLDEHGRARIRGEVRAGLQVCCQRCMQPMPLAVDATFMLTPVTGLREAEQVPEGYEPLMLDAPLLHPMDLVEDELILAIPPAPRHAATECGVDMAEFGGPAPEPQAVDSEVKANPFAVLQRLKRDSENGDPD